MGVQCILATLNDSLSIQKEDIMIEVRLFAGLRQGRQKVYQMEPDSIKNVQDIMDVLNIERKEVNILLINGFHQKPETEVKDEDIVSLFPAVGGG